MGLKTEEKKKCKSNWRDNERDSVALLSQLFTPFFLLFFVIKSQLFTTDRKKKKLWKHGELNMVYSIYLFIFSW